MLLALLVACDAIGSLPVRARTVPWPTFVLTGFAVAGIVVQIAWDGAMSALDNDPGKAGWWRIVTSVFLQNGGVLGTVWNLVTLALVATLASWFWGSIPALVLFVAGALVPNALGDLAGGNGVGTDPRDFAGSSGATYFLVATVVGAVAIRRGATRARALGWALLVLGIVIWVGLGNAHGLVIAEGFVVGVVGWMTAGRYVDTRRYRRPRAGSA